MLSYESRDTTVTLPATARQSLGRPRTRTWTVTVLGRVSGSGDTLPAARTAAADAAAEYIRHAADGPAFARDADGALIVAVPDGSGTAVYRVTGDRWSLNSYSGGTPADAVAGCYHWTVLPDAGTAAADAARDRAAAAAADAAFLA